MYAIRDEVTAWSFDRAVHRFGSRLEAELADAGKGAKNEVMARARRERVMARWLGAKQQFKDPVAAGQGSVSSEGSGIVQL